MAQYLTPAASGVAPYNQSINISLTACINIHTIDYKYYVSSNLIPWPNEFRVDFSATFQFLNYREKTVNICLS